jgi:predicted PurR-regulated permease PerM
MQEPIQNTKISISTGTIIRFFLVLVLLAAIYFLSDVVVVIVAAVVIASTMEPVIRRLKRRKIHRIASVITIYVLLALVLAAILIFLMPLIVSDATNFLSSLPKTVSFQELWSPISNIGLNFGSSYSFGEHVLSLSDVVNQLRSLVVGSSDTLFQTAGAIFGGLFSFLLIVVLSFYLAVKEEGVDDFLRIVAPVRHHDYIIDLWKRSQRKMALWLQGQVILGIVVGILVYILLKSVGIEHALLFALFAAILEIIPVFGPIISSIPPILLAFTDRGLGTGLLLVCLYIIIYQLESQVLYPLVVRKIVGISPIVVILALVIGAKLAGVLGALIAVPLSAALMEYLNDIEKYKNAERAERAVLEKVGKVGK